VSHKDEKNETEEDIKTRQKQKHIIPYSNISAVKPNCRQHTCFVHAKQGEEMMMNPDMLIYLNC